MEELEWVILVTDHYTQSKAFYSTTLELPIIRDVPGEEFTQFKLKHGFLAIYGRAFVEHLIGSAPVGNAGGAIYTFAQVPDVDELIDELQMKGVPIIRKPTTQPWGQRTAYFTDPDGHIWEVQQWLK